MTLDIEIKVLKNSPKLSFVEWKSAVRCVEVDRQRVGTQHHGNAPRKQAEFEYK